jgi:hypothetical protein
MRSKKPNNQDRVRETTRRAPSQDTVFLSALSGTGYEDSRVVIRNDVYVQALEAAKRVLRIYHSERRRQL